MYVNFERGSDRFLGGGAVGLLGAVLYYVVEEGARRARREIARQILFMFCLWRLFLVSFSIPGWCRDADPRIKTWPAMSRWDMG